MSDQSKRYWPVCVPIVILPCGARIKTVSAKHAATLKTLIEEEPIVILPRGAHLNCMSEDWKRGVVAAADVASNYDSSSTYDYRLGDCILANLNVRSGKPRRNIRKQGKSDDAFVRGFTLALVEMHKQLIGAGRDSSITAIMHDAGMTLKTMRDAGVDGADLRRLKKAGAR